MQVAAFKLDSLAGFGCACRPPLSLPRGDQERLLRRLELLRLVRQETARQETFQSITSVIQVDQVRGRPGGCGFEGDGSGVLVHLDLQLRKGRSSPSLASSSWTR
jgi:hypothetical protein